MGLHPELLGVQEEHCAKEYCATHNKNKESKKLRIEVVLVFCFVQIKDIITYKTSCMIHF